MASAIAIGSASMTPIFIAKVPQNLFSDSSHVSAFGGLKALPVFSCTNTAWNLKTVTNGSRVQCMQVVNPLTNHRFETLSYLPPLTPEDIAKDVEYLLKKGWIPCLEFDAVGVLYRKHVNMCGYYDGRYWTMWKLPMFGCQDAAQVLTEIEECKKAYPNCYIRLLGFDNKRQVQCTGFVVHRPVDS